MEGIAEHRESFSVEENTVGDDLGLTLPPGSQSPSDSLFEDVDSDGFEFNHEPECSEKRNREDAFLDEPSNSASPAAKKPDLGHGKGMSIPQELLGSTSRVQASLSSHSLVPNLSTGSASAAIQGRFALGQEDVAHHMAAEELSGGNPDDKHFSPYGLTNYRPSAPNLHSRRTDISSETLRNRLSNSRRRVDVLTAERNRYRNALMKYTSVDPETGKLGIHAMESELATLRRVCSTQQRRAKKLKADIEDWKGKYVNVACTHNSLISEHQALAHRQPLPEGDFGPSQVDWESKYSQLSRLFRDLLVAYLPIHHARGINTSLPSPSLPTPPSSDCSPAPEPPSPIDPNQTKAKMFASINLNVGISREEQALMEILGLHQGQFGRRPAAVSPGWVHPNAHASNGPNGAFCQNRGLNPIHPTCNGPNQAYDGINRSFGMDQSFGLNQPFGTNQSPAMNQSYGMNQAFDMNQFAGTNRPSSMRSTAFNAPLPPSLPSSFSSSLSSSFSSPLPSSLPPPSTVDANFGDLDFTDLDAYLRSTLGLPNATPVASVTTESPITPEGVIDLTSDSEPTVCTPTPTPTPTPTSRGQELLSSTVPATKDSPLTTFHREFRKKKLAWLGDHTPSDHDATTKVFHGLNPEHEHVLTVPMGDCYGFVQTQKQVRRSLGGAFAASVPKYDAAQDKVPAAPEVQEGYNPSEEDLLKMMDEELSRE
ncbi:hypothetical protein N7492_010191 [Penicillium capsulatum]|uniref:Uncharacterized protein n=1 Tax=Penicillium capsulatum TaxID=69766 RepID=A0A9W9LDN4_9EURO|nr:hypothetical protein N7492_010191 [Penicillium capsulatum]